MSANTSPAISSAAASCIAGMACDAAAGRSESSNQMILVGPAGLEPATGRL